MSFTSRCTSGERAMQANLNLVNRLPDLRAGGVELEFGVCEPEFGLLWVKGPQRPPSAGRRPGCCSPSSSPNISGVVEVDCSTGAVVRLARS